MKRVIAAALLALSALPVFAKDKKPHAYLTLEVSPARCMQRCAVTLKAEIHGPITWCPSAVLWVFDDGWYGGEKDSREGDVEACEQRVFVETRVYGPGKHRVSVAFKSGDALVAAPLRKEVEIGISPALVQ